MVFSFAVHVGILQHDAYRSQFSGNVRLQLSMTVIQLWSECDMHEDGTKPTATFVGVKLGPKLVTTCHWGQHADQL